MKKIIVIALIALLFASTACASVGVKKDGDIEGNATYIDISGGYSEFAGNTLTLYANGYNSGVTTNVSTESHLTAAALAYGVIKKVGNDSTSDYKVTLANGTPGQMITIVITTACASTGDYVITDDGVDGVTAAALLATGWDDIALDGAGDFVTLLYLDDTNGWVVVGQYGAAIT